MKFVLIELNTVQCTVNVIQIVTILLFSNAYNYHFMTVLTHIIYLTVRKQSQISLTVSATPKNPK